MRKGSSFRWINRVFLFYFSTFSWSLLSRRIQEFALLPLLSKFRRFIRGIFGILSLLLLLLCYTSSPMNRLLLLLPFYHYLVVSYLVEVTESSRARKYNYRSYRALLEPRSCREDVKALVVRVVASFSFFCKQDTSSRSSVQDDTISQTTFVRTLLVADD